MFGFFERLVNPFLTDETGTPPRRLLPFLLHYARPLLPFLLLTAVLSAAVSGLEIAFFTYLGRLVDWLAAADPATLFADQRLVLIGMGLVIVVLFPLVGMLQSLLLHQTLFGNFPMRVRWIAHRYMLGQSLPFFHDDFAGRVSQKVMQTALAVRETITKLIDIFVYVVVYFAGSVWIIASADLRLAAPLLVWLAGYIVIARIFVPRMRVVSMAQAEARAMMTGRVVDSYTNIQTIKLFAHTDREQAYARDAMQEFLHTVHKQMRLITQLNVSLQTLNSLLLAGIALLCILAWQRGAVSLGAIAVAIALTMRIRAMSNWILWEIAGLFENIGTVQDGIDMLTRPRTVVDMPNARELVVRKGEIQFDTITFAYGQGSPVFAGLSLQVRPGERIGLVGRSGAGKSTLVNLLLRFYDLQAGRILIDGQNVSEVTQESLRRQIGMVTQDTSLLHRSIRDNIRYGKPDASEAEIVAAAKRAQAHEFILGLTDSRGRRGYDALVGERGVKLSGGQRQRIAIARILLKNAPILVLDEATSALDSEVEAAIGEQLYTLMEGKTVIAIAHRLSTIAMLDRLVVIDAGRIVEQGSHAELLQRDGLYARLWKHQSGGFLGLDQELREAV